jgi:hypothetical protein
VVGFGDRGEVGFGVDLQVMSPEPAQRDLVGERRQFEGESEVGVDPATLVLRACPSADDGCGMLVRSPP